VDEIFKPSLLAVKAWEGAQLHKREWSVSLAGMRESMIARCNVTVWGMAAEQPSGRAGWEEESAAAGGWSNGASAVATRGGAWPD
jgi:hypothetical protein